MFCLSHLILYLSRIFMKFWSVTYFVTKLYTLYYLYARVHNITYKMCLLCRIMSSALYCAIRAKCTQTELAIQFQAVIRAIISFHQTQFATYSIVRRLYNIYNIDIGGPKTDLTLSVFNKKSLLINIKANIE